MRKGLWIAALSVALLGMLVVPAAIAEDGGGTPAQSALTQAQATLDSIFGDGGALSWLVQGNPPADMSTWDAPYDAATEGDLGAKDYVTNADSGASLGVDLTGVSSFASQGYVRVVDEAGGALRGMAGTIAEDSAAVSHAGGLYVSASATGGWPGDVAGIDLTLDAAHADGSLALENSGSVLVNAEFSDLSLWADVDVFGVTLEQAGTATVTNTGNLFVQAALEGGTWVWLDEAAVSIGGGVEDFTDSNGDGTLDTTPADHVTFSNDGGTVFSSLDLSADTSTFAFVDGVRLIGQAVEATNSGVIVTHASLEDSNSRFVAANGVWLEGDIDPASSASFVNAEDGIVGSLVEVNTSDPAVDAGTFGSYYSAFGISAWVMPGVNDNAGGSVRGTVSVQNAGTVAAEVDVAGCKGNTARAVGVAAGNGTADWSHPDQIDATVTNDGQIDARVQYSDGQVISAQAVGVQLYVENAEHGDATLLNNEGASINASLSVSDAEAGEEAEGSATIQAIGAQLYGRDVVYGGLAGEEDVAGATGSITASMRVSSTTISGSGVLEDPVALTAGVWALTTDDATVVVGEGGRVQGSMEMSDVSWENASEDAIAWSTGILLRPFGGDPGTASSQAVVQNEGTVTGTMTLTDTGDNGSSYDAAGIAVLVNDDDDTPVDVAVTNDGQVMAGMTVSLSDPDKVSEGSYSSWGVVATAEDFGGVIESASLANSGLIGASTFVSGYLGPIDTDGDGEPDDTGVVAAVADGASAVGVDMEGGEVDLENSGAIAASLALDKVTLEDLNRDDEVSVEATGAGLMAATSIDVTNTGTIGASVDMANVDWNFDWPYGEATAVGLDVEVEGDGSAGSTIDIANGGDEGTGAIVATMTLSNAGGDGADYAVAGIHATTTDDAGTDLTITNGAGSSVYATIDAALADVDGSSLGRYRAAGISVGEDDGGIVNSLEITNAGSISASVSVSGLETEEAVTPAAVGGASAYGVTAVGDTLSIDSSGSISASVSLENVVYDDFLDVSYDPAAVAMGVSLDALHSISATFDGTVTATVTVTNAAETTTGSADYEGVNATAVYLGAWDTDGDAATLSVSNGGTLAGTVVLQDATGDNSRETHQAYGLEADLFDKDGGAMTVANSGTISGSLSASGETSGYFHARGAVLAGQEDAGTTLQVTDSGRMTSSLDLSDGTVKDGSSIALTAHDFDSISIESTGTIAATSSFSNVDWQSRSWNSLTTAGIYAQAESSVTLDLEGSVLAATSMNEVDGWGNHQVMGVYAVASNPGGDEPATVAVENLGTITASGTFGTIAGSNFLVAGAVAGTSRNEGNSVDFVNRGDIGASLTVGGASFGDYDLYGLYLGSYQVTATNWGTITVAGQRNSGADVYEYGVYIDAPGGATFENFGTISVTGNVAGCAICFEDVTEMGTLNSTGPIYTGARVRALSLEGDSQITLQAADGGVGAFSWAFAGDPGSIVRPVYVGSGSALYLNDGILYAYLTPTTSYDSPYWLFDVEGSGNVVGSFSQLRLMSSHPDFTAQMLGSGEETRVQFGYQPRHSIGPVSVHAGMTAVRQLMDSLFNYQAMEFGWHRQIARAAGPVQVASIRPYVGSLSPAAAEQGDARSTFYVRPIYGGSIDASDLGYDGNMWGFELGYRYQVTDDFTLGVFYGYGENDIDMTDNGYQANEETQEFNAYGAFARMDWGQFYGMLALSVVDMDHEYRGVTGCNMDVVEEDDYNSSALAARLELGWAFDMGNWSLVPNAGVAWTNWDVGAHHTTATDSTWNRYFERYDEDFSEVSLGVDINRVWAGEKSTITFFAGLKAEESLSGNETSVAQWIPGMATPRVSVEQDVTDFSLLGNIGFMAQKKNLRLTLGLAERYNSDYTSWTGYAQVGYRF